MDGSPLDFLLAMTRKQLLSAVTRQYLHSRDFNGLPVGKGIGTRTIRGLIKDGTISLNRGDRHENPHIKAFQTEPILDQLRKLDESGATGCLYPEPVHLNKVVVKRRYAGRPFTLRLALGEPQLSFLSFDLAVLELYRNDPRYHFSVNDIHGTINIRDKHYRSGVLPARDQSFLQRFGFSYDGQMNRAVAVCLRYLSGLTPEHQRIWDARLLQGDYRLRPDYYANSMGRWTDHISVFTAITGELHLINEMSKRMGRKPLFKREFEEDDRPAEFAFLLRPTLKAFNGFVHVLDKMISENIDREFFMNEVALEREKVRKDGKVMVERKGTLKLLEEWLNISICFPDPTPKDSMLQIFRKVREMRQKPAHAVDEDEFDQSYFKQQRALIIEAYEATRTLRLILSNHPASNGLIVPDPLRLGKIWTY